MARPLFINGTGTTLGGYTLSPAATQYRPLTGTITSGQNALTVVLAAGASSNIAAANARFNPAIPAYTGTAVGSYKICTAWQTTAFANLWTKVRVHRATLSGTALTIATSSEWSGEILTNKANQRWEHYLDQVDLGTWSSTDALVVEYNFRNAGASSISPSAIAGGYYYTAVYTPFDTTAGAGYTNQLPVGQRQYNYSQGGIRGTSRYLKQTTSVNTSSGTATGTKGGSAFSGSVTGVSTSSGTIAAGRQGYSGASTGASTSSGTIAAGRQGYTGSSTGSSTSSGTVAAGRQGYSGASTGSSTSTGVIAAGRQGYAGAVAGTSTSTGAIASGVQGYNGAATGVSTSTGTAHGTPSPQPEPEPGVVGSVWRAWNSDFAQERPKVLDISARSIYRTTYSFGMASGAAGFSGTVLGESVENGSSTGQLGYYGGVTSVRHLVRHRLHGKARHDLRGNRELLVLIGEL